MGAVLIHLSVVLLNVKLRVAGGGAGELAQIRDDRRSRSRLLESQRPEKRRSSPRVRASGVFAPLVGALVFKTSGGFEQSSLWVRFPYTPVPFVDKDLGRFERTAGGASGSRECMGIEPTESFVQAPHRF